VPLLQMSVLRPVTSFHVMSFNRC